MIGGASTTSYVVADADVDRRLRVRVTAANADGQRTVASNATATIRRRRHGPSCRTSSRRRSAAPPRWVNTLRVSPGTWNGVQPITFTFQWLRCDGGGNNCVLQPAFADDAYLLREGTSARPSAPACSPATRAASRVASPPRARPWQGPQGPAGQITLPNGEKSIPVTSVPANESLVVDQAVFSPNPDPVADGAVHGPGQGRGLARLRRPRRAGLLPLDPARDAERAGSADGPGRLADPDVTPERDFPALRNGYNLQFYVKAYRQGDPMLAGIAGTRLVQVPLSR